jgi:Na+-transporting NADH:ubiquinone oxidoreductase subunit NqrD
VWSEVAKRGSQFIGLVVTRTVVRQSVQSMATKVISKQVAKFIPFGGQMVAAGLGYFVLRRIVYQHIDDCYAVAKASFRV